jgi:cephalosporin hydroxylase
MTFSERVNARRNLAETNRELKIASLKWLELAGKAGQQYTWDWLGLPIIQISQDIVQFQELVYQIQPELIVETGIARGGSLLLSASVLCLLDIMEGLDPRTSPRKVVGVDIDIRPRNRKALEEHPLSFKMQLIEGSSVDARVISRVQALASGLDRVMVSLDSNHTHDHVLNELDAYAGLVTVGSYCIVFDTVIEDLPSDYSSNRPWGIGNNPKTAVSEWLRDHPEFEIDSEIDNKLLISVAPSGYLRRVR